MANKPRIPTHRRCAVESLGERAILIHVQERAAYGGWHLFGRSPENMSHEISVSPGEVKTVLSDAEASEIISGWVDVFARKREGCRIKDYKWHIFSGKHYASIEADDALTSYRSQSAPEYVVIDNDESIVFTTDQRPEKVSLSDFYVCPRNFAWTMAFTHEDGWLGPYFAVHSEYERLNQENQALMKKLEDLAHAKKMGWI